MLDLLDYRRHIFELYRMIREAGSGVPQAHVTFHQVRDALFATHSQSPLDDVQKPAFVGLRYYAYDPAYRVLASLEKVEDPQTYHVELKADGAFTMRQLGQVQFDLPTGSGTLGVFWIANYGGGVFIPFRDATNNTMTYGGGRYLLDTIKGADLGMEGDKLVLDFNYAYHPSCHYNPRWVCPLAPPQNRLQMPVEAGEKVLDVATG